MFNWLKTKLNKNEPSSTNGIEHSTPTLVKDGSENNSSFLHSNHFLHGQTLSQNEILKGLAHVNAQALTQFYRDTLFYYEYYFSEVRKTPELFESYYQNEVFLQAKAVHKTIIDSVRGRTLRPFDMGIKLDNLAKLYNSYSESFSLQFAPLYSDESLFLAIAMLNPNIPLGYNIMSAGSGYFDDYKQTAFPLAAAIHYNHSIRIFCLPIIKGWREKEFQLLSQAHLANDTVVVFEVTGTGFNPKRNQGFYKLISTYQTDHSASMDAIKLVVQQQSSSYQDLIAKQCPVQDAATAAQLITSPNRFLRSVAAHYYAEKANESDKDIHLYLLAIRPYLTSNWQALVDKASAALVRKSNPLITKLSSLGHNIIMQKLDLGELEAIFTGSTNKFIYVVKLVLLCLPFVGGKPRELLNYTLICTLADIFTITLGLEPAKSAEKCAQVHAVLLGKKSPQQDNDIAVNSSPKSASSDVPNLSIVPQTEVVTAPLPILDQKEELLTISQHTAVMPLHDNLVNEVGYLAAVQSNATYEEVKQTQEEENNQIEENQQSLLVEETNHLTATMALLNEYKTRWEESQEVLKKIAIELTTVHAQQGNWKAREIFLLEQQQKLQLENSELLQSKNTLTEQCDALTVRIRNLEAQQLELEKYKQDAKALEQLEKSLEDTQKDLANREKEWRKKQELADKALQAYQKVKDEADAKAELLATQLTIFEQHGLPPQEKAYQSFLSNVKRLFRNASLNAPSCFISYAWEDDKTPVGKAANEKLQTWLLRLKNDFKKLTPATVFFDLTSMHGNLRQTMRENINSCDFFLLIGTPRFKQRVEAGLTSALKDCINNNSLSLLKSYLDKLEKNDKSDPDYAIYNPMNNAAFEFIHIFHKIQSNPSALIPLLYEGDYGTAFPAVIFEDLIRDARDEKNYYSLLSALKPLGIIPVLFKLYDNKNHEFEKNYQALLNGFTAKLKEIELEIKLAQAQLQAKQAVQTMQSNYQQHGLFSTLSNSSAASTSTSSVTSFITP